MTLSRFLDVLYWRITLSVTCNAHVRCPAFVVVNCGLFISLCFKFGFTMCNDNLVSTEDLHKFQQKDNILIEGSLNRSKSHKSFVLSARDTFMMIISPKSPL